MGETVEGLGEFVSRVQFNDLPKYVVHEMKRVIMDSIGCGIAGHMAEKGKIAAELAKKLSGLHEATILGTEEKGSCAHAAFANGELINALDYDAISSMGGHDVPALVSAILASGELVAASGKDLILATALALEISQRLKSATGGVHTPAPGGHRIVWPAVYGYSASVLAAAAGAGRLLNLDKGQVANAIGIAGYICPPSTFMKFLHTTPVRMAKYGPAGWGAQAGVTAALLAEMGYTGDTKLFEGEHSFWRYTGKGEGEWDMEGVMEGLGTSWTCHQIQYKQYPAGL